MTDKVFDNTIHSLNDSLNLRLMNQNIITSNISNADTPGYKAKHLEFEKALRESLDVGNELKMAVTSKQHLKVKDADPDFPNVYEETNNTVSLDGNTVDRSAEMAKMAENQLIYDASIQMIKKKLGMLKYGITEGGGNR